LSPSQAAVQIRQDERGRASRAGCPARSRREGSVPEVRSKHHLWAAVPLALLLIGAAPRPAAANVLCQLAVSDKVDGKFGSQMQVGTGQKFFLRLAVLNTSAIPLVSVIDIPGLKVRVGNVLTPFSVRSVLLPKIVAGTTLAAVCNTAGTFRTSVLVRFLDPFSGRIFEVADSVQIVVTTVKGGDDKKGGKGKDDKKGDDKTPVGELGGQQSGGTGGQQAGGTGGQQTGTTGGQQTGTTGGQQTGTTGGQQTGGTGKDDKKTGGTGGQSTGGTGGQSGDYIGAL
jgi:hypothetical protein